MEDIYITRESLRRMPLKSSGKSESERTFDNVVAFLVSYEPKKTKRDSTYLRGTLMTKDGSIDFKVWDSKFVDYLLTANFKSIPVQITCSADEYRGDVSLNVTNIVERPDLDPMDFMQLRYDRDSEASRFMSLFNENLSEQGTAILKLLLQPVWSRFIVEYAARMEGHNHDNVISGLLAHSRKCLDILNGLLDNYPTLSDRVDKDLIFLGVGLHDIGKVVEYDNGAMSGIGQLVSHRSIALEMLNSVKPNVIELKGEEFYYRLMSIFAQHHGEYEERPRTVEAYLAHLVDNMEAQLSGVDQNIEGITPGTPVWYNGFPLS